MQELSVFEAQKICLSRHIPFYSYRFPGERELHFGAQLQGTVKSFDRVGNWWGRDGFVAVPFLESKEVPSFFIHSEISFQDKTSDETLITLLTGRKPGEDRRWKTEDSICHDDYHRQVTAMIDELKKGNIRKMVLSRGVEVRAEAREMAVAWFHKLVDKYPEAFVFLVSVPGVMTWMGATPEIFLEQTQRGIRTMALAGTRPAGSTGEWGEKEVEEQAIVTEYISSLLGRFGNWRCEGPFSKKAGQVEHLCTTFFSREQLSSVQVEQLRRALHPTPAVGGFPVQQAVKRIREIEGRDRRYYAGYLGPVGSDSTLHWFVNLRCMELFADSVYLYVGGGITALSDPEKEWQETELKARTLLDVIG